MNKHNKQLRDFAIQFIENHYEELNKEKLEISYTKDQCLKELYKDMDFVCWVIMEAMSWGCDKNYINDYKVECDKYLIKIDKSYYTYNHNTYTLDPVKVKYKKVAYFD